MATTELVFDGIHCSVRLADCDELLEVLRQVVNDWPYATVAAGSRTAIIEVSGGQAYHINAPWLEQPQVYRDRLDAACGLVAELALARVHEQPMYLALHGAAVYWRDQLIFFPSSHRAGKSTLVAALAAKGAQVFADDVLVIDTRTDQALANGIAPRVRLPLPPLKDRRVTDFIRQHVRISNARYAYLGLGAGQRSPYGSTAPVGILALLARSDDATTSIVSCGNSRMLEQLIQQNFASAPPATRLFSTLQKIVTQGMNFILNYADCDAAAELMLESLDNLPAVTAMPRLETATSLYQGASVHETRIDGESFLVSSNSNAIYKLEPIAGAIWRLLAEEAYSISEIIDLLTSAFPDVSRTRIEHDVENLLTDMLEQELITTWPPITPDAHAHS